MNIDGLGDKIVGSAGGQGLGKGCCRSLFAELEDLAGLERMAEKSAQNLLDEIEASKKNSLARLIYALGIQFVGERTAHCCGHFSSLENWQRRRRTAHRSAGSWAEGCR